MGLVKKFFRSILVESDPWQDRLSERVPIIEVESHLAVARYGDFRLTNAVRPAMGLPIVPEQGFRRDRYLDLKRRLAIPVLICSISAERLFDTLLDLLNPLGEVVDVVLETSHHQTQGMHRDFLRRGIDLPILKSILCDYEEILLHDGCVGLAVIHQTAPIEIQLDEHKIITIYAHELEPFERILRQHNVRHKSQMRTLPEAEHIHSSHDLFEPQFVGLKTSLGGEILRTMR